MKTLDRISVKRNFPHTASLFQPVDHGFSWIYVKLSCCLMIRFLYDYFIVLFWQRKSLTGTSVRAMALKPPSISVKFL